MSDWYYILIVEIFFCLGEPPNEECYFETESFEFTEFDQALAVSKHLGEANRISEELGNLGRYDVELIQIPYSDGD